MILYTTNCPKCRALKYELQKKGISFKESNDFEKLISKKIFTVPVIDLEDGSELMNFDKSMLYLKGRSKDA